MSKEELSEAREQINKIDDEMGRLFELRMEAAKQIAQYKKEHGLPIKDKRREDEMIERLSAQISDETIRQYYVRFLRSTIDISCDYQHVLSEGSKVAYCGEKGAFAYFAMKHIFPDSVDCRFDTFADAYESVVKGECDYAVLPMENSASGEVGQVTDMLFSGSLYVTAMYDMPINQSLIGVKGASLGDIKKIYSHPQAISQCAKYLQRHKIEAVETSSTSAAIKYVSELNDKTVAAIGCEQAADFYGMNILDPIINEQRANTTRFGVFSKMLFLLFLLLAGSVNGYGQSMTEGQIIQFVQQEQQKGSDQQTIVAKLLQKGVTVEQLRNIRKKYEAQKSQLGAVNLQDPVRNSNNTAGRMRTKKETEQERLNRQNGYMIRSQREELEEKGMSRADRQNALNDEIAFMDIDSLIYYQNHFQKDDQVFGRNIFNNKLLTFEPNQNMATPANYLLGAGDKVVIDVWGASQQTMADSIRTAVSVCRWGIPAVFRFRW